MCDALGLPFESLSSMSYDRNIVIHVLKLGSEHRVGRLCVCVCACM